MLKKLNPREKRTLLVCGIASLLIAIYFLVIEPVRTDWKNVRSQLKPARQKVALLKMDEKSPETQRQKRLLEMVPVLEMPRQPEQQGPLFQETFTEQLKKAGLKSKRIQLVRGRSLSVDAAGYTVLNLQSQGVGSYDQILKLLADLPQNPYYVGVQKLALRPNQKEREKLNWELTVFTYAQ